MKAILTFDVEEFDVPMEFGRNIPMNEQIEVSLSGMQHVENLLKKYEISATIFCTGQFALHQEEFIRKLSKTHEIASHGLYHSSFDAKHDLKESKRILENLTQKPITGFRMARMMQVDDHEILNAGYKYNASLNPTFLPGRYNHFDKPKLPFYENGLFQIPASVSPTIRIPLFWLSFKNLPFIIYKYLANNTLNATGTINLYFHPWEFTDLSKYDYIPNYIRRHSKQELLNRLEKLIIWLQSKNVEFITMENYAKSYAKK